MTSLRTLSLLLAFVAVSMSGCSLFHSNKTPPPSPDGRPAWMPAEPSRPPNSSRVGIMPVLADELVHVHAGSGGFTKAYPADFRLPDYAAQALRTAFISRTPYQPVIIRPSAKLMRDRAVWQESWKADGKGGRFVGGGWQQEFEAIMKQNSLAMLIVISAPRLKDTVGGSSQLLEGTGLYTRSFLGRKQTAVFSTIRFYRLKADPLKLLSPDAAPDNRAYANIDVHLPAKPEDVNAAAMRPVASSVKSLLEENVNTFVPLLLK